MTKEEAIGYIESYGWSTMKLGLERTRELLGLLGDPQKKLKFVHVTGSNGKGSVCSMTACGYSKMQAASSLPSDIETSSARTESVPKSSPIVYRSMFILRSP